MNQDSLTDNWSLQVIAELFHSGLPTQDTHTIDPDTSTDSFIYNDISYAAIALETLFDFLTDLVLRNQLVVDDRYALSWQKYQGPLETISDKKIIRTYPFLDKQTKINDIRSEFVERLCVTSGLRKAQERNNACWKKGIKRPENYLSQTLWGGAGMLARSFAYELSYTPHPIRKRFFYSTGFLINNEDSASKLHSSIKKKRATLVTQQLKSDEAYSLELQIPPIPAHIIQESNTLSDLIHVALQLREEYQELRDWLGCYQQAITQGNLRELAKHKSLLNSVSKYIDSKFGVFDPNAPTFTTGISVLKIGFKGDPINSLKNQFGVRSLINRLILHNSGSAEIKKLLGFFDHDKSAIGLKAIEYFTRKSV